MTNKAASEKKPAQAKVIAQDNVAEADKADSNKALETFKSEFKSALKRFVTSTRLSMRYAQVCAEMSLRHFEEHGNLTYAQQFLDAMPENYVRRAAFVKWLMAHAPIIVEEKKLRKDKSDDAVAFNIDAACSKPFWEFAPDKEDVIFESTDVVDALKATLRKFRRDRYHATDDDANKTLTEAEEAVRKIGKHHGVEQVAA